MLAHSKYLRIELKYSIWVTVIPPRNVEDISSCLKKIKTEKLGLCE